MGRAVRDQRALPRDEMEQLLRTMLAVGYIDRAARNVIELCRMLVR